MLLQSAMREKRQSNIGMLLVVRSRICIRSCISLHHWIFRVGYWILNIGPSGIQRTRRAEGLDIGYSCGDRERPYCLFFYEFNNIFIYFRNNLFFIKSFYFANYAVFSFQPG